MDSIERKKPNPYHINEKEILDIVAAKGSYLSCISGDLEEVKQIVQEELERIKNDPVLCKLLPDNETV